MQWQFLLQRQCGRCLKHHLSLSFQPSRSVLVLLRVPVLRHQCPAITCASPAEQSVASDERQEAMGWRASFVPPLSQCWTSGPCLKSPKERKLDYASKSPCCRNGFCQEPCPACALIHWVRAHTRTKEEVECEEEASDGRAETAARSVQVPTRSSRVPHAADA